MKYFGGKAKIAKGLSIFLNKQLAPDQPFVDMFCGSCNVISKIDPSRKRYANDLHSELIALHLYVQAGGALPAYVSEAEYNNYKINLQTPAWLRAFAGFGCSYGAKWWGGYARAVKTTRNYADESSRGLLKKHLTMTDVIFTNLHYRKVPIEVGSFVYCDIPYKDTTKYSTGDFDHQKFYEWAENLVLQGCDVYVSEYEHNVPDGWDVVWRKESKQGMHGKNGKKSTIEVLMTPPKYKE